MELLGALLIGSQLVFTFVAGLYFYTHLKTQQTNKHSIHSESKKEIEKLRQLRMIELTEPLSEKTRPECFDDIVGQEKGIKGLQAALCGSNPQHILIYGPPGVGKTAAARIVLEHAKKLQQSPFKPEAPFIEVDATILQFDERSIADPLIGSVHDPIYQGAGSYGVAGIPQPKSGAVTKAHGGILFIDEIGELQQIQMNKLLKVLEDRKVNLNSSYYSAEDNNIPKYIHDIFKNGLPADFRLIGATTRSPEEIPPALRSRCTEIYFRPLSKTEIAKIAENACKKANFHFEEFVPDLISKYSSNGRDTVNIVQTAVSIASLENRRQISVEDVETVVDYGRYSKLYEKHFTNKKRIGVVNGLAVCGLLGGTIIELEAMAAKTQGKGVVKVTGIVDEEELNNGSSKVKRQSMARGSVENVITVMKHYTKIDIDKYNIHVNFPSGVPVDGPSAGITIFTAIYSAITETPICSQIAMTGEISIKGKVLPVGGTISKVEAAIESGIKKVIIPKANEQKVFQNSKIEVIYVENIEQLIKEVVNEEDLNSDKCLIDIKQVISVS